MENGFFKDTEFAKWKDLILTACAVVGGVLGLIGFIRSF